ncbi:MULTISPECIES: hypothetical protein [Pacificibacter]|uniref:hypothetical protein n=1 Tax=Pacificibacter TaxID=1042323 RepID=UPI001C0855AD|nr:MULTISPECIES: hypothetical protein [Pacificibacter]MBU2936972.1 hypothetical protein [Pacificibacter marinus]MDO6617148.1 hypothetical protein [Pacificibacter sp. 1_MG-2023]
MYKLLLMLTFVLALVEPESADADEVLARIDRNTVVTDAARDDGFSHGEQIWIDTSGIVRPSTHRVGTLQNARYGYKYGSDRSVFVDPDNSVESVFVNCRRDRISGRNLCFMNIGFSNLQILLAPNGRATAACVMRHDFPGRAAAVRVEGYQLIRTDETGCVGSNTAVRLLKQLSSGQTLHVQRVEWPYDVGKTTTMQINGKVSIALQIWKFTNGGRFSEKLFRADTSLTHRQDIVRRNGM